MSITPGAGVKVGSAYVDITPKLNQFANAKVLAEVNKELQKAYTPDYAALNADQKKNQEIQARSAQQATAALFKNRLAAQKEADKASVDAEKAASAARNDVAKAETRAYQEEARRRGVSDRALQRQRQSDIKQTEKAAADAAKHLDSQNTNSEGVLHKLATQFRTVGTIARGLSAISIVPLGFEALVQGIGLIRAALPVVAAGLVALPGLIAAAGVEAVILKVSFNHVGAAIKDGFDPTKVKQFNQQMKALSPAARSFVKDILQLKNLKLPNLQQQLFGNANLQAAGKAIAPTAQKLAPATAGIASASGGLLGSVLGGLETKQAVANIRTLFIGMATGINNVLPGLRVLEAGLLSLIGKDGAFGGAAGTKISNFFTTIGHGLSKINVAQVFHDAGIALNGFWNIAKNLGGTIGNIVKAMGTQASGQGFLGGLGAVAKTLNSFTSSKPGQAFLTELFKTLSQIANTVSVVLGDALNGLAKAFVALQPQIGPFLKAIKDLAKDLPALGTILGGMAAGALTLGTTLLNFLNPPLQALVDLLAKIPKPVLMGIAEGLTAIYLAIKAYAILTGIIKSLNAVLVVFNIELDANPIGVVIIAVVALGVGIFELVKHFKQVTAFLNGPWGTAWSVALIGVAPFIGIPAIIIGHWRGVLTGLKAILNGLVAAFKAVEPFIVNTVPSFFTRMYRSVVGTFNTFIRATGNWVSSVTSRIGSGIANFVTKTIPGFFTSMYNKVVGTFNTLIRATGNWITSTVHTITSGISNFVTRTIPGWFATAHGFIDGALDGIRNRIKTFVKDDITGAFNSVKNFVLHTIPGWFSTLQHDIVAAIKVLVSSIKTVWNTIVAIFKNPVDTVINVALNPLKDAWNVVDHAIGGHHQIPPIRIGKTPKPGKAAGGFIDRAYGGPTQDNVFLNGRGGHPGINVSGGEYVLKASSVASIPPGYLNALNKYGGKAISGDPSGIHIFDPKEYAYAAGGSVPAAARARVPGVLGFLHNIAASGVPYGLGAVGPRAYDCSSLVGEVWARLTGNPSYHRYFVTGNEASWLGGHGFAPGKDPTGFTVGLTNPPEHTVGMLGGHRFEAAHTGTTMRFDGGAANALNFAKVFHMIGMSGVGGGFGIPAALLAVSTAAKFAAKFGAIFNKIKWPNTGYTPEAKLVGPAASANLNKFSHPLILKAIQAAQAAANSGFGAGAALGNVGSGSVAKWIAQASKFSNIPSSWVSGLEYIIQRESGNNPNAQNNTDINARNGIPSQGLGQLIPPVFRANHAAGTSGNIKDPVANIAAMVNYIRKVYGSPAGTPWLRHTGTYYSAGGPVITRDRGGIIPTGLSNVFNGTGKSEYAFTTEQLAALRHDCHTTIYLDGVDVTSKAHVTKNNDALTASLNRRTGR